jgi:acyl-CoA dehydrogenase
MPFSLTDEQRALYEEARTLAREELAPIVERGTPGRVNRPLVRALAAHGLLGRLFPENRNVSATDLCILREAVAQGSTEAETALAMQGLGGSTILRGGTPATVDRWLRPIARGEAVAAFALTEPEHGSDAGAIDARAEPVAGGYRLSGVKTWISNAPDADVYALFARTMEGAGARGVTAFAVPGDSEGLRGEPLELLGPHPIGRLELDGVFVPEGDVLGEVGGGFRVAMKTLDLFRPSVGAFAVGMAHAALGLALAHAGERRAFGKPLKDHQAIAHQLAEMATRTEAARLMVYAAADAYDRGAPGVTKTSAMAKLYATEAAQFVVDAAVQIHGAAALERGHLLEHLYREVRAPRIYEGTSEIQREVIARELYR